MLVMRQVTKVFRTADVETHALRALDLTIGEGEFVAITGPSGSGKTTFLNLAGLLDVASSGTYTLNGEDVGTLSDNARSDIRSKSIGFVFQNFNLFPDLTVFGNVELPLRYRGMPSSERRHRVESTLTRVGLSSRMHHYPGQLSGGQQQRAAIARALAGSPRMILADEPTGNLDTLAGHAVMDLFQEINASGSTVVLVTHDPALAARAHRRISLVDGCVRDRPNGAPLSLAHGRTG